MEKVNKKRERKHSRVKQRREYVNRVKIERGCKICGYNENGKNLMFLYWPGPMRLRVSYLIKKGERWSAVLEKIESSEVYCKSHARRHRRTYIISKY
jgi:hypothetical protein